MVIARLPRSDETAMKSPRPLCLRGEYSAHSPIWPILQGFVERLAADEAGPCSCNHYSPQCEGSELRRANLLLYLRQVAAWKPKFMLVGEASGYRGCRLTGVPFTSEAILAQGTATGMFGCKNGYRIAGTGISREQTASIMWETLERLGIVPLLWNAYPFHPFRPGNQCSNRAPSIAEIDRGARYVLELVEMFEVEKLVAVGNKAYLALTRAGVKCEKIRHPSHGGKAAFVDGLMHEAGDYARGPENHG